MLHHEYEGFQTEKGKGAAEIDLISNNKIFSLSLKFQGWGHLWEKSSLIRSYKFIQSFFYNFEFSVLIFFLRNHWIDFFILIAERFPRLGKY